MENKKAHFNSIKVQLKQITQSFVFSVAKFQFHKGTIKADRRGKGYFAMNNFNSIKVQLKLNRDTYLYIVIINFNSIKVQLKQGGVR